MQFEPCERCLGLYDKRTPAHYDHIQRVKYALCLKCQEFTQTGINKIRLSPVGSNYDEW